MFYFQVIIYMKKVVFISLHNKIYILTLTAPTAKNTTPISAYKREHETRLDDVTL